MKRVWIGAGLLAALLTVGLVAGAAMEGLCPGARKLEQAGELALAEDWEGAESLLDGVEEDWEKRRWLMTALADHEVIEDMDAGLAQLEALMETRDGAGCHALCRALARKMEAVGKAQSPTGENFF